VFSGAHSSFGVSFIYSLRLADHSSRVTGYSNAEHVIASMVLKWFATRSVTKEEVARALRIVAKNEPLCGSIKDIELTFCALVKDGEFHKLHSYNQTVLKLLEKLEAAAMTANADMTRLAVEEKDSVLHLTKGKLNNKNFQLHLNHNHTIHNYYA
jgi:hypothetical protein